MVQIGVYGWVTEVSPGLRLKRLQSIFLEEEPYFEQDLECYEPFTQDIVNYVF